MKVLYLVIGGVESPGVQNKILSKVKAFNNVGIDTRGLFFTFSDLEKVEDKYEIIPLKIKIPKLVSGKFFWRLLYFYRDKYTYTRINEIVQKYQFDVIIFRYSGSNYALKKFARDYSKKIIFEFNARILIDLIKYNVHNSFLDKYKIFSEKKYFPSVMKHAKAIISVTKDILIDEVKRAKVELPTLVLGNGVDLTKIKIRKAPEYDGKLIKMCISIGASNQSVFGLERLANSIAAYNGSQKFEVYIAGRFDIKKLDELNNICGKSIFFSEGLLNANQLQDLYASCHLAFAALAMYILDANYSSSLKVNEYLASGIPFFLAYIEPVLSEIKGIEKYYCMFEKKSSLLDMNIVIDFLDS